MKYCYVFSFLMTYGFTFQTNGVKTNIEIAPYYGEKEDIIMKGIMEAKEVLKKEEFYKKISEYKHKETKANDYSHTIEHPEEISKSIKTAKLTLKVRGYKGGDNTGTLAYVTTEHPNTIFINVDKVEGRTKESIAATIIHEIVHSVDRQNDDMKFGHGGNSSNGKSNSAPYAIGRIAQALASDNKNLTEDDYHDLHLVETESIDESNVMYGKSKMNPEDPKVIEEYMKFVEPASVVGPKPADKSANKKRD